VEGRDWASFCVWLVEERSFGVLLFACQVLQRVADLVTAARPREQCFYVSLGGGLDEVLLADVENERIRLKVRLQAVRANPLAPTLLFLRSTLLDRHASIKARFKGQLAVSLTRGTPISAILLFFLAIRVLQSLHD